MSARHVWEWFWQLSGVRAVRETGPDPLSPSMIRDWSELTGTKITREEFAMLVAMDRRFRDAWAIEAENNAAIQREESQWT